MSGLILLALLGIWISVVTVLTGLFTKAMQPGLLRGTTQLLLFMVIFIAPVADEIIGGFQFRELCKSEAIFHIVENKAAGKTVKMKYSDEVNIPNYFVKIYSQSWTYRDVENDDVLVSGTDLHASGGWLSRVINFNSVNKPYTFKGVCGISGNYIEELFARLNIKTSNQ